MFGLIERIETNKMTRTTPIATNYHAPKMLVSIMTAVLNSENTIERCVRSVMNQKCDLFRLEHVIQDGMSVDGTLEIIHKLEQEQGGDIIRLVSEKDCCEGDGKNRCLSRLSGDVWIELNGDDELETGSIERAVKLFQANPGWDAVIASDVKIIDIGSNIVGIHKNSRNNRLGEVNFRDVITRKWVPNFNSIFFRMEPWHTIGLWVDRRRKAVIDFDLLVRWLGYHNRNIIVVPNECFVRYRRHEGSTTQRATTNKDMTMTIVVAKWDTCSRFLKHCNTLEQLDCFFSDADREKFPTLSSRLHPVEQMIIDGLAKWSSLDRTEVANACRDDSHR
jgi:glycosyltransferase involved in cell wall biosynthesis